MNGENGSFTNYEIEVECFKHSNCFNGVRDFERT